MINKFLETSNKGNTDECFLPKQEGKSTFSYDLIMIIESFTLEETFKIKSKW